MDKVEEDTSSEDPLEPGPEDDRPMSFWEHVTELRRRLIGTCMGVVAGFAVSFMFVEELLDLLKQPLRGAWHGAGLPGAPQLQVLEIQGALMVDIRVALTGGIFLAAPVIAYEAWQFISPGLYRKEKIFVIPFVTMTAVMFGLGATFAYVYVLPYVIQWLLNYNEGSWVNRLLVEHSVRQKEVLYQLELSNYVKGSTRILLAFAAVFEFPLVSAFLAKIQVITHKTLLRYWRVAILIIFVVAGFLTPPEPVTQLMMAGPMVVLFFASVVVAYIINPGPKDEIEDAPDLPETEDDGPDAPQS